MVRSSTLAVAAAILALAGCAKKPAAKDAAMIELTSARVMRGHVHVDDDLLQACDVKFGNRAQAPKFDFDEAELLPEDRDVLAQIASCVTTGPLQRQRLVLVGRADPRGEEEYNMALGEHRADSVRDYLARLGVEKGRLFKTSRGELDADGQDERTWREDRRVDVLLLK
jgi:peptidoglycan-associated lipoprotein